MVCLSRLCEKQEVAVIESLCWGGMKFLGYETENVEKPSVFVLRKGVDISPGKLFGRIRAFFARRANKNVRQGVGMAATASMAKG